MILLFVAILQASTPMPEFVSLPPAAALRTGPAEPIPAALADVPHLRMIYYNVSGSDVRTIRRSINAQRPTDSSDGERVDAVTRWNIQTRWSTRDGQCLPATAEATLTLEILLPRLTNYARLPRSEQQRWDRYINQLTAHERNHAMSAVRGLSAVRQAMRGSTDCATMQAATQAVFARISQINADYDRRTDHGRREGIVY